VLRQRKRSVDVLRGKGAVNCEWLEVAMIPKMNGSRHNISDVLVERVIESLLYCHIIYL
jgi:hypothetical protein